MSARQPFGWGPLLTAFSVWFVHFMVCWSAAEIWPRQWQANALAWGATIIALLAVGVHARSIKAHQGAGEMPGWHYRFAQGAMGIATVAVLFSAVPSLVFLP